METSNKSKRIFTKKSDYNRFRVVQELKHRLTNSDGNGIYAGDELAKEIAKIIGCKQHLVAKTIRKYSQGEINEYGKIIKNTEGVAIC